MSHQQQQRRAFPRPAQRPRPEPPTLEEIAGITARRLIRDAGLPDTVENWRAQRDAALSALEELIAPEQPEEI